MRHHAPIIAILTALALAGCGTSQRPTTSFNTENDAIYTEQQVADLAGFQPDDYGAWTAYGCDIDVIMTTRASVEMYASAGDAVVTNPAGTVGVKFGPDPGCRDALLSALRKVK